MTAEKPGAKRKTRKGADGAMPDAREIAYDVIRRVEAEGAYLSLLLRYRLEESGLSARDRSLVSELTYGVQRHRNRLDYIIAAFSARPIEELDPEALQLLRMGVYQLAEMRVPPHAAVNETVKLAKKTLRQGAASYVNAVLRAASGGLDSLAWPGREDLARFLEVNHSHPRWMAEYLIERFGEDEAEAICAADNAPPTLTLRANLARLGGEGLAAEIEARRGRYRPSPWLAEAVLDVNVSRRGLVDMLQKGLCVVQDQSSMLVAHAVDPAPGSAVLDACAAPGGKATHLAAMVGAGGRVIAMDRNPRRLEAMRALVERLGLENVDAVEGDAAQAPSLLERPVDAVLVDAPCSGLGTLQRRPELKWRRKREDLPRLAELQLSLLEGCAEAVRPGGVLVYSVCTFCAEETFEVVEGFLARRPEYRVDDLTPHLPEALAESISPSGWLQLMPHLHGTEGMFIARMAREESGTVPHR